MMKLGHHSAERKHYIATLGEISEDEPGIKVDVELLDQISNDENTTEALQDENEEQRRV